MLDLLVEYARREQLVTEPGFAPKDVRWALDFDANGQFLGVLPLGNRSDKRDPGRRFTKCPDLTQPELTSGGQTKSHFLVDTCQVVANWAKSGASEKEIRDIEAKHGYFVRLLRDASTVTPCLKPVADSLADDAVLAQIRAELSGQKASPTDKITIRVDGAFPVEDSSWHAWWQTFRRTLARQGTGSQMICLATGQTVEPARTHPKISGLSDVGGMGMGSSLIGYDKDAFQSFGLSQSENGAVSEEAAAAYRAALNHLLDRHSRRLAEAKVAHWFKDRVAADEDPLEWLESAEETEKLTAQQRARELLEAIRTGQRPDLQQNHFYALTISGAAGRAMVRDWMEGQFEELVRNINGWFDDFSVVNRDGTGLAPPPKFMAVLGSTVRELDDLAAPAVAALWRSALTAGPIPRQLVAQALARARCDILDDQAANHARFGLIKAFLVREGDTDVKPYLNEDHPSPAYHCGRLMAEYAQLQHAAQGDVGAGVVQRFYAAASATPSLVLGRLARLSQFHLNKLEPGRARYFETRIADIWARIGDRPPGALKLEEQSLFALGYYQQLAADRARKAGAAPVNSVEEESNV
ncbi:MAG: CRISPR-associated Csd1 family protein [Armatimonadota bacterium]|nr:MAG: CRISPR-associated Csd1 family protein [Armatimonadota bacterium]